MVAVASDHGGYGLKTHILKYLEDNKIPYKDYGCFDTASVDYPDYALQVAEAVAGGEADKGILICGTGIGMCIAANKVPGIRAALCHDCFSAQATREHNDSNILAMGERVVGPGLAVKITDIWLNTEFQGGRHSVRVGKISQIEDKYLKR